MRRMWLRAALLVILPGAALTSGACAFLSGQRIAESRHAGQAFDEGAWAVFLSLAELRAAQQSYVAAGQDLSYWTAAVTERLDGVSAGLSGLSATTTLPASADALDEAAILIAALARMDEQARGHAAAGRSLMASDLIFADGLELGRSAADHVERARQAEQDGSDAATASARWFQALAVATMLAAGVAFALVLSPLSSSSRADGSVEHADAARRIRNRPPRAVRQERLLLDGEAEADKRPAAAPAPASAPLPEPQPDLRMAADLCTALGRSTSPGELQPLLEQAAGLLNARYITIWVRDGSGAALRPALGHGYSEAELARFGTIACDDANVAADAYREARVRVSSGGAGTPGVIIAPLIAPDDCPGVVAIEVNDGWETSGAVQSTAAIVAAQLATLVAADPANGLRKARS